MAVTLIWKIKNLDLYGIAELHSPTIRVGCYDFRLVLNPAAGVSKSSVSLSLNRLADQGEELVIVSYELALVASNENLWPPPSDITSFFKNTFKKNACWIDKSDFSREVALNEKEGYYLLDGSIRFRCIIHSVKIKQDTFGSQIHDLDDGHLTRRLGEIFETGEYSDIVIMAEGKTFYAHRIVLKARCPRLYRSLEEVERENVYLLEDVKASDLRAALLFLYTGIFELKNLSEDFHLLLDKYHVADLKQVLSHDYSQTVEATSEITVIELKFCWTIENFSQLHAEDELKHYVPSYCTAENEWGKMTIVLTIVDEKTVKLKYNVSEESGIGFVRFKLASSKYSRNIIKGAYRTSECNYHVQFKILDFAESMLNDSLSMLFEFELGSKKTVSTTKTIVAAKQDIQTSSKVTSLERLQQDFYDLVHQEQRTDFSDVTLKTGTAEFHVHKVFLCGRSPVFDRMFQSDFLEKRKSLVTIEDVSPATLTSMLQYIYSGLTDETDVTETMNLYAAADKYELLGLKGGCSGVLLEKLGPGQVGEVLLLADMHEDEKMKTKVYDYISINPRPVLCFRGLEALEAGYEGYPELVNALLQRMH